MSKIKRRELKKQILSLEKDLHADLLEVKNDYLEVKQRFGSSLLFNILMATVAGGVLLVAGSANKEAAKQMKNHPTKKRLAKIKSVSAPIRKVVDTLGVISIVRNLLTGK